jgi:SAM-dependent methyltransferase
MDFHAFEHLLTCPECGAKVSRKGESFQCNDHSCGMSFPIFYGVPVFISEKNAIFQQEDFNTPEAPTIFFGNSKNPVVNFLRKLRPDVTLNYTSKLNYTKIAEKLKHLSAPKILVIGGSIDGTGMSILKQQLPKETILVESDVAQGPNTNIIFDAHHIPFEANTFDLVIAQAVLEHVLDPFHCVREIERVLTDDGIVYAETPFMQQVHGGKYDFHRFTDLGHRRLFRHFEEIDRGLVAGPGSSLAWSLRYFFLSFAFNKTMDRIISYGSSFLVFWLKYFDYLLNRTRGAYDGACGLYFIGTKKAGYVLPDQELLHQYKGYRS